MLPPSIPLFPLPNVVLFPNVFLPLHIFEPRYRAMVSEALHGDRIIGIALLQPGYEAHYEGRPPVFPVGCAGVMTHAEPLGDGTFNIVLRGMERFRIAGEDAGKLYRIAHVSAMPEGLPEEHRAELRRHRHRLEALLAAAIERAGSEPRFPPAIPDDDLVNALAQYLDFEPLEKQALLEQGCLRSRAESLVELLEMKILMASMPGLSRATH